MIQLIIGAGLGLGGVAAAVAIKRYNEVERKRAAGPADHWGNKYEPRIVSRPRAPCPSSWQVPSSPPSPASTRRTPARSASSATSAARSPARPPRPVSTPWPPWQDVVTYDTRN